jgi:outer membrane protein TolC
VLVGSAGCVSLDPTDEIRAVADRVESRIGIASSWDAPWDEFSGAWDGAQALSSDAAVIVALQNNRVIRQQVESIVAARADFVQAHLLPNPVVTLAIGIPIDGGGGSPLAASLIQQLAWLWQRPTRIDEAEANLEQQVLAVSDAVLLLVARVRTAHADLVHAERAVVLQERNCQLVARSQELVELQFRAGEASQIDVNRLQLEWLRARAELVERVRAHDVAKRRLLEHLARADADVSWTTDDRTAGAAGAELLTEAEVMAAVARLRLDAAAARMRVESAAHRVELARLGALPEAGVGAGFQQNFSNREGVFPTVSVTPKPFDDNRARIARAESQLESMRIEADRVLQQAQREVRTAWIDLQASRRLIRDYQERIVHLADENAALAQESFAAGTVDLTVLLEAQREQTTARTRLNDLRAAATRRFHELERAVGGTLRPDLLTESDPDRKKQITGVSLEEGSSS